MIDVIAGAIGAFVLPAEQRTQPSEDRSRKCRSNTAIAVAQPKGRERIAEVRDRIATPDGTMNESTRSDHEIRARVRAYFSMLEGELRGRSHRHRFFARENGGDNDDGPGTAYRQIAAVLVEQGLPFHSAHRPVPHFPARLREAVAAYLRNHPELLRLMEADVDEPAGMVPDLGERGLDEIASRAPERGEIPEINAADAAGTAISGIDFLAREQRNHSLAWAGELFVIEYEIARLHEAGAGVYADAIEHVAAEQGAGGGFDIHSYDADGRDRYIKVKTTRYGRETPFFVTTNEIAMAATHREHFWLYRLFGFRESPRMYAINGSLHDRFRLEPTAYRATPR